MSETNDDKKRKGGQRMTYVKIQYTGVQLGARVLTSISTEGSGSNRAEAIEPHQLGVLVRGLEVDGRRSTVVIPAANIAFIKLEE